MKYYYIPKSLIPIVATLINVLLNNNVVRYVCIRSIEPIEPESEPAPTKEPTGIMAQQGEIYISSNCLGLVLEGYLGEVNLNLETIGMGAGIITAHELAIQLGCTPHSQESFINFEKSLLSHER